MREERVGLLAGQAGVAARVERRTDVGPHVADHGERPPLRVRERLDAHLDVVEALFREETLGLAADVRLPERDRGGGEVAVDVLLAPGLDHHETPVAVHDVDASARGKDAAQFGQGRVHVGDVLEDVLAEDAVHGTVRERDPAVGDVVEGHVSPAVRPFRRIRDEARVDVHAVHAARLAHHVRDRQRHEPRPGAEVEHAMPGTDGRRRQQRRLAVPPLEHALVAGDPLLLDVLPVVGVVGVDVHGVKTGNSA